MSLNCDIKNMSIEYLKEIQYIRDNITPKRFKKFIEHNHLD